MTSEKHPSTSSSSQSGKGANKEDIQDRNAKVVDAKVPSTAPVSGGNTNFKGEKPQPSVAVKSEINGKVQPNPAATESRTNIHLRDNATFSWGNIAYWNNDMFSDKLKAMKQVKLIETYVLEHFYADWYWNTSLMVGTCFFGWLAARIGGGFLSLIFVLLFTCSVYKLEFRRFNRNVRDDMTRVYASNRLENELESMEWLNSFLDKFWVIYMPAFSATVMFQANQVMEGQAPGFGIVAISLDEFTLGSKAPRIDSVKSYTKKGQDHIEMEWAFSFAPNNTDDMTKNQIKKKINPKVALGVTIGKAFISKSLPILVEDMSMTGRLSIKLKLTQNFPHVKMVSVQFLEAPTIDYSLKPVGGDTLGIDIMSFIPGLAKFVNGLIHANLSPYLYAPNSLDIDVEALMASRSNDSNGVVAVTIKKLTNLKIANPTPPNSINPYVQLKISNNSDLEETTSVKKLINDPVFIETKYLLVNSLDGNHLNLNVYDLLKDKADDKLIGTVEFPLSELLQQQFHLGLIKNITEGGRTVGKIEFDVRWYPELPPMKLDDGTVEPISDSEVGIMKVNLHEAADLDISQSALGMLNPYAELYVNYELVKTCRKLRLTNEPAWDESFETLITQKSDTRVQVYIKDAADNNIVARLDANVQDLTFETSRGQQWITSDPIRPGAPTPKFRITTGWKALGMQDDTLATNFSDPAIGAVRIHLHSAKGLKNLESVGKVDPYVRIIVNGRVEGKTPTIANTLEPYFNDVFFFPAANEHQHYLLEIMDEEVETHDRTLGSCAVSVFDFLKKDEKGNFVAYDGSSEIIEQPVILSGKQSGLLKYSVSFIPTVPVFSNVQLKFKDEYKKHLQKIKDVETKKQLDDEKLAKEKPDEYEWVELKEDDLPMPAKHEVPLSQLLQYKAGVVNVSILSGNFEKNDVYVQTLFDDNAYPCGVSTRSEGKTLTLSSVASGFTRDLPNSKLILRLSNKVEVVREKEVICERIFNTLDILKKAKNNSVNLNIGGRNTVQVQLDFIPAAIPLAPLDTVLDVGIMKLGIIKAANLPSVDSNGKSDPLVVVKLDGIEIFKSEKKRKTLDPVWSEEVSFPLLSRSRDIVTIHVYDWDLTHDDELLGSARLDFSQIKPNNETPFEVKLDTQGTVYLVANFNPQFVRPKLGTASGLNLDLGAVAGAPLKLVGNGAGMAGHALGSGVGAAEHVVGSGVGIAGETVTRGGSFLKNLGRSKRSKNKKLETLGGYPREYEGDTDSLAPTEGDNYQGGEKLGPQDVESSRSFVSSDPRKSSQRSRGPQVEAVPNINVEDFPAPQRPNASGFVTTGVAGQPNGAPSFLGHARSDSGFDVASSFAPSVHGSDAIPGRISVISATGYTNVSNVEVRVLLKTSSREKELYKTRATKLDRESGSYKWNESVPFKAASTGNLHFIVREHHTFGKSIDLGHTAYPLSEALHSGDNIVLNAGEGQLTIHIKYGSP